MREREQRGGLCENRWNTLKSRVMGCKEDRVAVCPQKGEVQHREVRRVEEKKVQRKWHEREMS